jgi:hypothetical protein
VWNPLQITGRLQLDYPGDDTMHISDQAIRQVA